MIYTELIIWRSGIWVQLMVVTFLPKRMHWEREVVCTTAPNTEHYCKWDCQLPSEIMLCDRAWNVKWRGKCQSGGSKWWFSVSYLFKDFCWKSFGKKQNQKYNTKKFEACVSNRIVTFPVLSSISTYLQFWQLCKQCMITSTSSYLLIKGCHLVSLLSSSCIS